MAGPQQTQHVDGRQPLGEHHRMPVRQQQHARAKQEPLGRRGDKGEGVERLEEREGERDLAETR
jgi:hypothetical protein